MLNTAAPASYSDTDWLELIDLTIIRWKLAGQYMLSKKTAGRAMVEDEEKYLADSLEAVSLPSLMFTSVISYDDAIGQARALTDQGNTWIRSANTYYHLTPENDRATNGLIDL